MGILKTSLAAVLVIGCVVSGAVADGLQTGTKTTSAIVVACVAGTSTTATLSQDVSPLWGRLWAACGKADLHPIFMPTACLDLGDVNNGMISWEFWLPLADEIDLDNPPALADVQIKRVPAVPVVYTYLPGNPPPAEQGISILSAWAAEHQVPLSPRFRAVMRLSPFSEGRREIMTECQFELKQ